MPHANPTEPVTTLKVAGNEYRLLFTFDSIAEAEDATNRALITGLSKRDLLTPRISLIRAMLYAALLPYLPKITLAEASALVTQHNYNAIWAKLLAAWVACMAESEDDEGAGPTKAQS